MQFVQLTIQCRIVKSCCVTEMCPVTIISSVVARILLLKQFIVSAWWWGSFTRKTFTGFLPACSNKQSLPGGSQRPGLDQRRTLKWVHTSTTPPTTKQTFFTTARVWYIGSSESVHNLNLVWESIKIDKLQDFKLWFWSQNPSLIQSYTSWMSKHQ